jgi:hypothetical protein
VKTYVAAAVEAFRKKGKDKMKLSLSPKLMTFRVCNQEHAKKKEIVTYKNVGRQRDS